MIKPEWIEIKTQKSKFNKISCIHFTESWKHRDAVKKLDSKGSEHIYQTESEKDDKQKFGWQGWIPTFKFTIE